MQNDQPVKEGSLYTLDLNFLDLSGTIASYLIPHTNGAVLVECGPGSTIKALQAGLQAHGLSEADVTDVLLTHIHLDHAGAAGWLARQGARIHVHHVGAPHMLDPHKLLSSAARIYGDQMENLWGEFLPVPEERLSILHDGDVIEIAGLRFHALDTPGHANHHFAYLFQDVCISGDIGGVRMGASRHLRLPMPPPELHLGRWRESLKRLQGEYARGSFTRIAPTHFGVYTDANWHLAALEKELHDVETWIEAVMPNKPSIEQLNEQFLGWTQERLRQQGLKSDLMGAYEVANPSWISVYGLHRYWRKFRE